MLNELTPREWVSPDGYLSFYHETHHKHGAPFADTVDSTSIWLMQEYLNGKISRRSLKDLLLEGFTLRVILNPDGSYEEFLRYPGSNTPMKRDQLDFFVPLLREAGLGTFANWLVKKYGGILMPHHKDHLYDRCTWLGRMFEVGASLVDWFSNSESGQLNNLARLVWASYRNAPNHLAVSLFRRKIDPWYAMVVYGARRPEDGAGKKGREYRAIMDRIYVNAINKGASKESPPPIYQGWDLIFDEYL